MMKFLTNMNVIKPLQRYYAISRFYFNPAGMQNNVRDNKTTWDPMEVFFTSSDNKYVMIVLNQPILLPKRLVLPMWKRAKMRICVDGGSNQWMEYLDKISDEIYRGNYFEYKPTFVTGDLDSILPDTITKLKNVNVSIINTPDQNYTDFSKALMQVTAACKQNDIHLDAIYVLVETAGRFDHIIGNINTLYQSKKIVDNTVKIINIASNSLTWLLHPGTHVIKIPEVLRNNNSWVGIIAFGTSTNKVTTSGLKWNLDNSTLAFGDMISTSNTYDGSPEVTVTTDTEIVWTMGIESMVQMINELH